MTDATYCVEESVSLDLRITSAHVVEVIALQRHEIIGTIKVEIPIVVAITSSRVRSDSVKVVVGNCHSVRSTSPKDKMLATNASGLIGDVIRCMTILELRQQLLADNSLTVTWSIHTRSEPSRVMASPPHTYLELISVIAMFLLIHMHEL